MYGHKLQWKNFNVSLTDIETWVKTYRGANYLGNSADACLTLWYSSEPDQTTKDALDTYWNGLTHDSDEAKHYVSADAISAAIASIKANIPGKTWDQMVPVERKIAMGLSTTPHELGLL